MREKDFNEILIELRSVISATLKPFLNSGPKKQSVHKATGVAIKTLEDMAYTGRCGIETLTKVGCYCLDLKPKEFSEFLIHFRDLLNEQTKRPTQGQSMWLKAGDLLTEDEKLFFAGLATAHRELKPSFGIKKKK